MAGLHRDTSFSAPLSGQAYAQPLYVDGGADGRDLVIVAIEANQLYAYDPVDGTEIYHRSLGPALIPGQTMCGNISPLGVTGTPVIDPATRTLYLDAMTRITGVGAHHIVHSISVDTGLDNWTVDVDATASFGGVAFQSSIQNQRGALAFLNGTVYIAYGGYFGDCGPFHGWVVGVSADGHTVNAWATRATGGGIWGPGSVASDGTSLYVATGNTIGATVWGDGEAIIRLGPGPTFSQSTTDYFAPPNWQDLDNTDADLGGSNVVLFHLPGAVPRDLALALGKDGKAYLADRANLGGFNTLAVQQVGNLIITAPSAYQTSQGTYVVFNAGGPGCPGNSNAIRALKIAEGSPPTIIVAWCASAPGNTTPIASPIVTTTDGTSDAVVWWIGTDRKLHASDGDTGASVFDGGGASDVMGQVQRSQSPIVAKGHIFVAANQQLHKFGL